MSEEYVTGYVTKYALTEGIIKTEGAVSEYGTLYYPGGLFYVGKNHWTTSEHDAFIKAEKMRRAKILSLEKQIDRLRGLEIRVVERAR